MFTTEISSIITSSCDYFDLTNDNHYQMVIDLADEMLNSGLVEDDLEAFLPDKSAPLHTNLAAHIALSRLRILKHKDVPFSLAIAINLIHEHNRLRPATFNNPNGENALRNKIKQLKWITKGTQTTWKLLYATGGCPWGSDEVLQHIIDQENLAKDQVELLDSRQFEIAQHLPKNQKGSEILFAMNSVIGTKGYPKIGDFDAFMFTDADMTLDMGQIGTLIDEHLVNKKDFIIGARTHKLSILRKNPTRPGKGVMMYRHITRRLGPVFFEDLSLSDTQCPWKFLSVDLLKKITPLLSCPDWSVDTDIIGAAFKLGYDIDIVPVTAIDSEKESHGHAISGGPAARLITIVQGLLKQARNYNLNFDEEIGHLVDTQIQTMQDLSAILNTLPPENLRELPNEAFGKAETINITDLTNWVIETKKNS